MSNHLWQRLGAASGIVYVLVILAPDLIPRGPSEELTMTAAEAMAQSCATITAARLTDAIVPISHILGYLFLSFFPLAVLSVACAVMAIRFGAPLPRWLGWMSAVVAVALLVDGMAGTMYARDFGPSFFPFMLWVLVTSIILIQRVGKPLPTVESAHRD